LDRPTRAGLHLREAESIDSQRSLTKTCNAWQGATPDLAANDAFAKAALLRERRNREPLVAIEPRAEEQAATDARVL